MSCPRCGAAPGAGAIVCPDCETALGPRCASCGTHGLPGFAFCGQCGSKLSAAAAGGATADAGAGSDAERRPLTVMFCDLAGSTRLSEQLDPEVLRHVVRRYQEASAQVVERHDGHIAQYLGDGLLVYYGYPTAHEEDARRAVRSALGILRSLAGLSARLEREIGVELVVRIGIHTGLVVIGEVGGGARTEHLALGKTPNLAARLQELAEPGTVVISSATERLVHSFFACVPIGEQALKGVAEPVAIFRVLEERAAHSRSDIPSADLTPLVGRRQVLDRLHEAWSLAREGEPRTVLLSGEAGLGKSRMTAALKESLAAEPHLVREIHCSPFYPNTALYPVTELLRSELGLDRNVVEAEALSRLEGLLATSRVPLEESVPRWRTLLSLPESARYPPRRMPPEREARAGLEAIRDWLIARSREMPLLFVAHDLHWVDPSTVELLGLLRALEPPARVLVLLTYRPAFEPPWERSERTQQIVLDKLPADQAWELVHRMTGERSLPAELIAQLVERTDGVPLFLEELTRTVLESGLLAERGGRLELTGPLTALAIPSTLQSSLLARLDRMGSAKGVAQLAAVFGRDVDRDLLADISPLAPEALAVELGRLEEAGILGCRDDQGSTYAFRHALIQEAAYESLLRSRRREVHAEIGELLESRFYRPGGPRPELLAHHFTRAGELTRAIHYWRQAGERALERSANVEAARHLGYGLELIERLDPRDTAGALRDRLELELRTVLGSALMAVRGYGAPEVVATFARAGELAEAVGEPDQRIRVLMGQVRLHGARAELETAQGFGRTLLVLAERAERGDYTLEAHRFLGAIAFHLGELVEAERHLLRALELYDPAEHRSHAFYYNEDTEVFCLDNLAWTLWHLGRPEEALAKNRRAVERAQELDHPFTLAHALSFRAVLLQFHGAVEEAGRAAADTIATAERYGFPHRLAMGLIVRGWAEASQGRRKAGIAGMEEGLALWRASGAEILRPRFLIYLAEAMARGGKTVRALELLGEAEELGNKTGERFHEADLYRERGEVLIAAGVGRGISVDAAVEAPGTHDPEAWLRRALATARSQGARLPALRAANSLARRLIATHRETEARALVATALSGLTEGFDGSDYRAARELLGEASEVAS